MRKIWISLIGFMILSSVAFAQNPLSQDVHDLNIKRKATALRNAYDKELILMGEQELIFENKVEEYLINQKKIRESNLSLEEKVVAMHDNYNQETADMGDILSKPQYEVYKEIKLKYQPLDSLYLGDTK